MNPSKTLLLVAVAILAPAAGPAQPTGAAGTDAELTALGRETPHAAPPAEGAAWVAILVRSPIRSLGGYHHALKGSIRRPRRRPIGLPPLPECDLEIRTERNPTTVVRVPHAGYFRENGEPDEAVRRRMGDVPDGDYLVALCAGDRRISNVARLRIDASFNAGEEPGLRLMPLPPAPGEGLRYVGLIATGRNPVDPAFTNFAAAFPILIVDGTERRVTSMTWVGPVGPLQPGQRELRLIDLTRYEPPIDPAAGHKVAARVATYESTPVRISPRDALGRRWDRMTGRLPSVPPPRVVLRGTVTGPSGKPAAGYEVILTSRTSRTRFRERTGNDGTYAFVNVPGGTYRLSANPPGKGQPALNLEAVPVEESRPVVRDLSLERKYRISGKVTYADGTPAVGREVMTTWGSADGAAMFEDFAVVGADGRWSVAAPFETATCVGLSGTGRQPRPHHDVKAGRNDIDFVLPGAAPAAPGVGD